jgi:hypothetical protein
MDFDPRIKKTDYKLVLELLISKDVKMIFKRRQNDF